MHYQYQRPKGKKYLVGDKKVQMKKFYSLTIFCKLRKDCHDSTFPILLNISIHRADSLRTTNLV